MTFEKIVYHNAGNTFSICSEWYRRLIQCIVKGVPVWQYLYTRKESISIGSNYREIKLVETSRNTSQSHMIHRNAIPRICIKCFASVLRFDNTIVDVFSFNATCYCLHLSERKQLPPKRLIKLNVSLSMTTTTHKKSPLSAHRIHSKVPQSRAKQRAKRIGNYIVKQKRTHQSKKYIDQIQYTLHESI